MALYLKVVSFNCRGLNNDVKRAAIFAHLRQLDAQIILLQETFSKPYKEAFWPTNGLLDRLFLIRFPKILKRPSGRQ